MGLHSAAPRITQHAQHPKPQASQSCCDFFFFLLLFAYLVLIIDFQLTFLISAFIEDNLSIYMHEIIFKVISFQRYWTICFNFSFEIVALFIDNVSIYMHCIFSKSFNVSTAQVLNYCRDKNASEVLTYQSPYRSRLCSDCKAVYLLWQ